jgi:hypothetical protein
MNLSHVALWHDEAYVATAAGDLLSTGKFTGWDGRNLNGFANGSAIDNSLRPVNAPLDILVCAASFKLLGQSVLAARLPFAIVGVLTFLLFALFLRIETRNEIFSALAMMLLVLSAAYLLYLRQSRYYSFSVAGALLVFIGYRQCLARRSASGPLLLAAGGILGFYANPMVTAVLYVALGIAHFSMYSWRVTRRRWLRFGAAAWLFLMTTAPYAVYNESWFRPDHNFANEPWLLSKFHLLWWNLRDLTWTSTLSYMILPFVAWALLRAIKSRGRLPRRARFWAMICISYILLLTLVSPQTTLTPWTADVRYHASILPLLACLSAYGLYQTAATSRLLALALLLGQLLMNPWTFHPHWPQFQWLLPAYLKEVHMPFPTSSAAVANYLRENAIRDETLFSSPEYMDYPVNFALEERLLLAGVLNKRTHLNDETVARLPSYLQAEKTLADWIVVYGTSERTLTDTARYLRPKNEAGETLPADYHLVKKVELIFRQIQRPELTEHEFGPMKARTDEECVYIFRRNDSQ